MDLTGGDDEDDDYAKAIAASLAPIDLTRTAVSDAGAAAAPAAHPPAAGSGAVDLSGPNFMAEARTLAAIFTDLKPAHILAVLMDFDDHHDDPVSVVSALLGERSSFGPESLASLPKPTSVKGPMLLSAYAALDEAVTMLLTVFPNADPTALRTKLAKMQEEGVDDLVASASAEMLEGYVRVSDAAALAAASAGGASAGPLPHELPFQLGEFLPTEVDGYEGRTMIRGLTARPTAETAESVPGWVSNFVLQMMNLVPRY